MNLNNSIEMSRDLADKYFNNKATPVEAQTVIEWFETHEGEQYLKERLEIDKNLMNRNDLREVVPELDSDELYKSIQSKINKKKNVFSVRRTDWLGYAMKAAASVLVILTASLFTITHQQYLSEQVVEKEPIIFHTGEEQHREIKLRDGTIVLMNSNSEIVVSPDYMHGSREISLTGEAYFDVEKDPEKPFVIYGNQSLVKVLGTAFNMRSFPGQENVQVAVTEGEVLLTTTLLENTGQTAVILSKGQYGYLNNVDGSIKVDDKAIENYLVWKNGRLNFENLTLENVCVQLNRLYSVECKYEYEEIKNLNLTANFSNESLEKTLSVIALSLDLEIDRENNQVTWINTSMAHE